MPVRFTGFILLLILSSGLFAIEPPKKEAVQKACRQDILSYCGTYALLGARDKVQACMKQNRHGLCRKRCGPAVAKTCNASALSFAVSRSRCGPAYANTADNLAPRARNSYKR